MGNYDDADEDHGNDDNYADVNPWVELTDQEQESLSELFDEQVQLHRLQGKSDQFSENAAFNSILPRARPILRRIYLLRLRWNNRIKRDEIHRQVMQTV